MHTDIPTRAAHAAAEGLLQVLAASRPPMSEVAHQAMAALNGSSHPGLRGVRCEFHEGVLTLRGRASSFYLKQLAQSLVGSLPQVEEIANRIEVDHWR